MTAGQVVLIDCDAPGCSRWMTVGSPGGLLYARRMARDEGWQETFLSGVRGLVDFCPTHRGSTEVKARRYAGNARQYV